MRVDEVLFLHTCGDLWNSMLGLDLETVVRRNGMPEEPYLSSSVSIHGPWEGAVQLQCPESVARHAAVMLLDSDAEGATRRELQEAMNELARRIVRAMDGLLPGPSEYADPAPPDDPSICHALAAMLPASEIELECEGRPVRVRILQASN